MSETDLSFLSELISIDSPTGMTTDAGEFIAGKFEGLGYAVKRTNKGALRIRQNQSASPRIVLAAHFDTLGAIVEDITTNGMLKVSQIGGYPFPSFEGAHCSVFTSAGAKISGTLLFHNPSAHADSAVQSETRKRENMRIRLDARVKSQGDVRSLGIEVGDFIAFEPGYREAGDGFIKSRFLDNKAGCFCLFDLAERVRGTCEAVEFFFSNYEEVGHGASIDFGSSVEEMLVLDMGVIGKGVSGLETHVSICAKDSTGPYDYDFRRRLEHLASQNGLPFKVSVYPHYGSDGSAALRAGNDIRVGLIGPGVSASHGLERTHVDALNATTSLCELYLREQGYLSQ